MDDVDSLKAIKRKGDRYDNDLKSKGLIWS